MTEFLPRDGREAILVGRLDLGQGPTPVLVKDGRVWDVSGSAPTVSALLDGWTGSAAGRDLGEFADLGLTPAWAKAFACWPNANPSPSANSAICWSAKSITPADWSPE